MQLTCGWKHMVYRKYFFLYRCLDSSGGYLLHSPKRAARIIETCCCLHNAAKMGHVKILKDSSNRKDAFKRKQKAVVQPANLGRRPTKKFANMRKTYISDYFQHDHLQKKTT